jgi:hypothetical protein
MQHYPKTEIWMSQLTCSSELYNLVLKEEPNREMQTGGFCAFAASHRRQGIRKQISWRKQLFQKNFRYEHSSILAPENSWPCSQHHKQTKNKQTPWPLVRERTIPTDRRHLSTKFSVNYLWIERCRVVSAADPLRSLNLSFIDRFTTSLFPYLQPNESNSNSTSPFKTHLNIIPHSSVVDRTAKLKPRMSQVRFPMLLDVSTLLIIPAGL